MKLQSIKKGFTLIELLVVITIIGILATGATTVFTAQIQKARDTTRIGDLKAVQSAVEQVYQDSGLYPYANTFGSGTSGETTGVSTYINPIPTDPKIGQPCNGGTTCSLVYGVSTDDNSIEFGEYELSIGFENEANRTQKGATDNGNSNKRFEVGIDVGDTANHDTTVDATAKVTIPAGTCAAIEGSAVTTAATATAVAATTAGQTATIYVTEDC